MYVRPGIYIAHTRDKGKSVLNAIKTMCLSKDDMSSISVRLYVKPQSVIDGAFFYLTSRSDMFILRISLFEFITGKYIISALAGLRV